MKTIVLPVFCIGAAITLIIFLIVAAHNNRLEIAVEATTNGCVAKTERVVNQLGELIATKITFENHTYIKCYQTPHVHLESCPCHTNVIIIEK